jgi:micrococcal nuclease
MRLLALTWLLLAQLGGQGNAPSGELVPARVVAVVDGDTIQVTLPDGARARVRLIGVDTPETVDPRRPVQCYGAEASAWTRARLLGQPVELERDVTERDRFGRLLRYVWQGGELVNAQLVAEGYAQVVTYPPDVRHAERFRALQQAARDAGRGLWSACQDVPPPPPELPPTGDTLSAAPPAPPPASPGFDPSRYLGQGDAYNCNAFPSQAAAQAVLRADPSDPNLLDRDRDGIACESNPLPRDLVPVPRL